MPATMKYTGKPCPDGYSVPWTTDWTRMFGAVENKTAAGLWEAMRLGMTTRRWHAGGALGTSNSFDDINWTYACYDGKAANQLFVRFDYEVQPVIMYIETNSQYCGFAVRCIRRVSKF